MGDFYRRVNNMSNGWRWALTIVTFTLSSLIGCTGGTLVVGFGTYWAGFSYTTGEAIVLFGAATVVGLPALWLHGLMWWVLLSWPHRFFKADENEINGYDALVCITTGGITLIITVLWLIYAVAAIAAA